MSDEAPLTPREAMEREKARLLKEAAAKQAEAAAIDRDLAELERLAVLAAKYNFVVTPASGAGAAAQKNERQGFDGSVASLVHHYRTDPRSPYRQLQHSTRLYYDRLIKHIVEAHGDKKLVDLKTPEIQGIYGDWKQRGNPMAHALATMLRGLVNFGASVLANNDCERISVVLHNQRFKVEKRRSERLTREQANAIRAKAHEMGLRSVALAQVLQFECGLTQTEVVGEWVPVDEPGTSEIIAYRNHKWLRGLRWNEIDENLKLRREKRVEIDLKRAPMVIEELQSLFCDRGEPLTRAKLPVSGPIIVYEKKKLPYQAPQFRIKWREVARAAGIPDTVKNRDSRAPERADHVTPSHRGKETESVR